MPIDYYVFPPSKSNNFWILVSSGMSHLQMKDSRPDNAHCELMVFLDPNDWNLNSKDNYTGKPVFENYPLAKWDFQNDPNLNWSLLGMSVVNHFPFMQNTWIGPFHTVDMQGMSIGNYYGWFVMPPNSLGKNFDKLIIEQKKLVNFYLLIPLYRNELRLAQQSGAIKLLELFKRRPISEIIIQQRHNVL